MGGSVGGADGDGDANNNNNNRTIIKRWTAKKSIPADGKISIPFFDLKNKTKQKKTKKKMELKLIGRSFRFQISDWFPVP